MPNYDIELFWQCSICTHIEGGLKKKCTNCGKTRTEKEQDIWPDDLSEANALRDPEKIRQAHAGPDWHCAFCGSSQRRSDGKCSECGSDQRQGREIHQDRKQVILDGDTYRKLGECTFHGAPAAESKATSEQMLMEDLAAEGQKVVLTPDEIRAMTDPFPTKKPAPKAAKAPAPRYRENPSEDDLLTFNRSLRRNMPDAMVWGGGFGIFGIFALILYFIFRTRDVSVVVSAVEWQRTVHIDRYRVHGHEGFDPSSNAFNTHSLGTRVHHYDHVLVGSHIVHDTKQVACGQNCSTPSCYTTSKTCTSNKNGTASCSGGDRVCPSPVCTTKYCTVPDDRRVDDYEEQPRYREYYEWSAWEWGHDRDASVGGNTTVVSWPTDEQLHIGLNLREGEQEHESGREEVFNVTFSGDGDTWKHNPTSALDFQRFPVGKKSLIRVNHAGSLTVLR